MKIRWILVLLGMWLGASGWVWACPDTLNYQQKALRSDETVDFCERFAGKVLLVVNTASNCGFTPQFKGLEALYQRYREQGFEIVGFPSDDFFQEFDESEKTAKVCYVNYGVTFTMLESSHVRGHKANSFFQFLKKETDTAPHWNFYKYLIGRDGKVIGVYGSRTTPEDEKLTQVIEGALSAKELQVKPAI